MNDHTVISKSSRRRQAPPLGVTILRPREVSQKVGLARTKILNLEATGRFPRRIQLPGRAVGWRSDEIDRWIDEVSAHRIDMSDRRYKKKRES
ncbi:MAG: AlpA family phage regulatory protein [Candidatus Competibacteraceae bacterium]|nr:AlpA family phage regulatory protein [Candidatus Competibacteraceae bacterium]MCB1812015.1 AlpA family phage regulatory protein [Candidatus Competibacteraceae bacterium]